MNELKKSFINDIIKKVILLIKRKKIILITVITIIAVLILITLMLILKGEKTEHIEENINEEELEMKFNERFNNQGNEYVSTLYHIYEEETGKYKVEADIPYIHIIDEIDIEVNKEINDIFVTKLLQVVRTSQVFTRLTIDYAVNINSNVLSLIIRCTLKEGNNAQRTIIKTYNYNIETNQKVEILELIPEERREIIQNKINQEIQNKINRENTIVSQGYPVYRRNPESDIYKLINATEFYIENDILYIIYSYGNNNFTSEVDLIINKV